LRIRQRNRDTPEPLTAFADAPQLREATLLTISLPGISLPWAQLTRLECWWQDISQCVQILRHTTHLESLLVHLSRSSGAALGALPELPVRLLHLHTLNVGASLLFLDHIALPALKHVDITLRRDRDPARLLAFLIRSECTLSSISLGCDSAWIANSTFADIPSLSAVYFPDSDWSDADITIFFTRIATDMHFSPNLETLSFDQCFMSVPYAEVVNMLESRWFGRNNESERLKSFRFHQHPESRGEAFDLDPALLERMQALIVDGLKIDIQT
jgi:hypothetical protein